MTARGFLKDIDIIFFYMSNTKIKQPSQGAHQTSAIMADQFFVANCTQGENGQPDVMPATLNSSFK